MDLPKTDIGENGVPSCLTAGCAGSHMHRGQKPVPELHVGFPAHDPDSHADIPTLAARSVALMRWPGWR